MTWVLNELLKRMCACVRVCVFLRVRVLCGESECVSVRGEKCVFE
jgi:hypothetical protein